MQGNQEGMPPYTYVRDNPETRTDPTGHWGISINWGGIGDAISNVIRDIAPVAEIGGDFLGDVIPFVGFAFMAHDIYNSFANPTKLGCGCITSSTSSSVVTTAQDIAGGMSKPRAWDGGEQKELAHDLSTETQAGRSKAIAAYDKAKTKPKNNPHGANGAMGVLTIMVNGNSQSFDDFELGYKGAKLEDHAEQKIVNWAKGIIEGYGDKIKGAVINLLIFTQTPPCSDAGGCMEKLTSNTWLDTLYTASVAGGGAAEVNLAVWQTNTTDLNNFSSEVSVCVGRTDGKDTESNC